MRGTCLRGRKHATHCGTAFDIAKRTQLASPKPFHVKGLKLRDGRFGRANEPNFPETKTWGSVPDWVGRDPAGWVSGSRPSSGGTLRTMGCTHPEQNVGMPNKANEAGISPL